MVRKLFLVIALLLSSLFMTTICSAEERKSEWRDHAFNLKTMKTIVTQLIIADGVPVDENFRHSMEQLISSQIIQRSNRATKFISYGQLEEAVSKYLQLDVKQLHTSDPTKYNETMCEWLPLVADAILKINIPQWGYTQYYVPEYSYTYTDYDTTYITEQVCDENGRVLRTITKEIKVPVERTRVVPAHYETTSHAGAEFSLINLKDQRKVWALVDLRDSGASNVPIEMTDRIFKRAMDRYEDIVSE